MQLHHQVHAVRLTVLREIEAGQSLGIRGQRGDIVLRLLVAQNVLPGRLLSQGHLAPLQLLHRGHVVDFKGDILQGLLPFVLAGGLQNVQNPVRGYQHLTVDRQQAVIVADHGLGGIPTAGCIEQIHIPAHLIAVDLQLHFRPILQIPEDKLIASAFRKLDVLPLVTALRA